MLQVGAEGQDDEGPEDKDHQHLAVETQEVSILRSGCPLLLRDWSLITGRGGLQNGKIAGPKLFAPPPPHQDRVELFAPPPPLKSGSFLRPPFNIAKTSSYCVKTTPNLFAPPHPLKSGYFLHPPFTIAKTSSYCVKTTPKLCVPPFSMAKKNSVPPFRRGKTSRAPPPLPLCSPPPRN